MEDKRRGCYNGRNERRDVSYMYSKRFEKEVFKEIVRDNVKTLYRKKIEEATPQQIFQAEEKEKKKNGPSVGHFVQRMMFWFGILS